MKNTATAELIEAANSVNEIARESAFCAEADQLMKSFLNMKNHDEEEGAVQNARGNVIALFIKADVDLQSTVKVIETNRIQVSAVHFSMVRTAWKYLNHAWHDAEGAHSDCLCGGP